MITEFYSIESEEDYFYTNNFYIEKYTGNKNYVTSNIRKLNYFDNLNINKYEIYFHISLKQYLVKITFNNIEEKVYFELKVL